MISQVLFNALKDPTYCPYCMKCYGAVRMTKVAPYLWEHKKCGAIHDERENAKRHKMEKTMHPDDVAVDLFAGFMKNKMADSRLKGRSGWNDPVDCPTQHLVNLLHGHIQKGDAVDVANFCMMLHARGAKITAPTASLFEIKYPPEVPALDLIKYPEFVRSEDRAKRICEAVRDAHGVAATYRGFIPVN